MGFGCFFSLRMIQMMTIKRKISSALKRETSGLILVASLSISKKAFSYKVALL